MKREKVRKQKRKDTTNEYVCLKKLKEKHGRERRSKPADESGHQIFPETFLKPAGAETDILFLHKA